MGMMNCSTSRHVETFQIQRARPKNSGTSKIDAQHDSAISHFASQGSRPRNGNRTDRVKCAGPASPPDSTASPSSGSYFPGHSALAAFAFHRNNQRYKAPPKAASASPRLWLANPPTTSTPNSARAPTGPRDIRAPQNSPANQ